MKLRSTRANAFAVAALLSFLIPVTASAASDVITVGNVTATGSSVDVPVYIRDVSGTSLGMDQPAGSRIQSFSIKVDYSPASAVQSISFNRAGVTQNLTPTSEFKPATAGSVSLLDTFQESSNLIPLTLNAAAPGNLVARLVVTLSPSATPGSAIVLKLDASLTQLTDSGGTASTKETVANGGLSLNSGQINIPAVTLASISPSSRTIAPGGGGNFSATLTGAAGSDTTVTLTSSNPAVATVPASIVIPAGGTSATFRVTAVAVGTARIIATQGSATATANITVANETQPCTRPAAPLVNAPSAVATGTPYNVSWNAVTAATEYVLEESTGEAFPSPAAQTLTGTSASFTQSTAGTRYYRVRARNNASGCDLFSADSAIVAVIISDTPLPVTRVLAVVGSLAGNFGSFFRTSLQLYNPHGAAVSGRIVFHPAGTAGSDGDPSLAYSILPGKTLSFADLLPAMGVAGGLGSADLIGDATSQLPIVLSRVFNDAGAAGTSGLGQDALALDRALQRGSTGVLLAPDDVRRFRLNVGVRTLTAGAELAITVRDRDGAIVKSVTRSYAPVFFTQVASSSLLDGYALTGGETISFEVTAGSAFVYGSTTDNTTNDPAVQFAVRID